MDITEAVLALDPANDDHWTADGMPRVEIVAEMMGDENVTRAMIETETDGFRRSGDGGGDTSSKSDAGEGSKAVPGPRPQASLALINLVSQGKSMEEAKAILAKANQSETDDKK